MAVNYEDERFQEVEANKQQAMTNLEQTYSGMIGEADKYYEAQINASKEWADKQSQLQQEQSDFTIEQIEQQKDKANKDYLKEQSGAYVDWRKQSNQYGTEAEKMASAGLTGTGFSESSQVSMYNTYQNRVAMARESFQQAVLNYDNAIKDARLQNNAALAEIAYNALQQQLELSLQGFQYKNQLIIDQANKKIEVDNMYWQRYQDVLNQINTENALEEEIRQFDKNYELQTKQYEEAIRQFNLEYEQRIKEFDESIRQFDEEIARLKKKDEQEYQLQIQRLELEKQQMAEQKRQFEAQQALQYAQLEEQKRQADMAAAARASSGGGGGGGGSSKASGSASVINKSNAPDKADSTYGEVDYQSVIALGYGPISAQTLAQKVAGGEVQLVSSGGKLIAVRTQAAKGTSALNRNGLYGLR